MHANSYALGTNPAAARRLMLQDRQFAQISEELLDNLGIRPADHLLELGIGGGSFSMRILPRLGEDGLWVGVDSSRELLDQASRRLAAVGSAKQEFIQADIRNIGPLAAKADVIVGRTVLHHLEFPELFLGELRGFLRPGTRLGFIEPEFRVPLGRLAALERWGRAELAPLRRWAEGISRYYQAKRIAPAIGASLALTLTTAGYRDVQETWWECPTDDAALENMQLYYDEVRERYLAAEIMPAEAIDDDRKQIASLRETLASGGGPLPAVWGMYQVSCVA